jgi:hypothetical protein
MHLRNLNVLRDEVIGDWRKLHNVELRNLYSSSDIVTLVKSRRERWVENVASMGEMRNACKILFGKPEAETTHKK